MSESGLIPLINDKDIEYGISHDFYSELDPYQITAVKRALSQSNYKAISYETKEAVTIDLIDACVEIHDRWKKEDKHFALMQRGDMNDFIWILKEYLDCVLSYKHNLMMEQ